MSLLELEQLQKAQELVELDPSQYPQIVRGILPFTDHDNAQIRQFCAQFLYNAFGSKSIEPEMKKALAVVCQDYVLTMLEKNAHDWQVLKPLIGSCSCLYSLLFSYVSENENETEVWEKLQDIKKKVLKIWNDEELHFSVEITCIKFAQQVISAQTYGPSSGGGDTDISLTDVPSGHLLIGRTLDAEALGLLDRLLGVFSERTIFAPKITCTVNALCPLVRSRPGTVQKILRAVLSFESSAKLCSSKASDTRVDLEYKFVDKCLKIFLDSLLELNVAPRMNNQIKNYLSTLSQGRASERLKKRMGKSTDSADEQSRKRVRSGTSPYPHNASTEVPTGPYSYTSLFNLLRPDDSLATFDAKELPSDIAAKIAMLGLAKVSPELLQNSINVVQARYKNLVEQAPFTQTSQNRYYPVESYGDDDRPMNDNGDGDDENENNGDGGGAYDVGEDDDEENPAALPPASSFSLAVPAKLSEREKKFRVSKIIDRLMSYGSSAAVKNSALVSSGAANANKGINRVAVSEWDENTWVLIAARTITRGMCDNNRELKDLLRNRLYSYVMENFRDRLEAIVTWLTEEWFAEQIQNEQTTEKPDESVSIYMTWTEKLLEQIVLLIDKSDSKSWLRLLSDLPELSRSIIWKIRSLCIDPDRSQLGFMSLRYLIMFKPPSKNDCLDLLEEMYKSDISKDSAGAILQKYRPEVVSSS